MLQETGLNYLRDIYSEIFQIFLQKLIFFPGLFRWIVCLVYEIDACSCQFIRKNIIN